MVDPGAPGASRAEEALLRLAHTCPRYSTGRRRLLRTSLAVRWLEVAVRVPVVVAFLVALTRPWDPRWVTVGLGAVVATDLGAWSWGRHVQELGRGRPADASSP